MKILICEFINQLPQNSEKDTVLQCLVALLPPSWFSFFLNVLAKPWFICYNCLPMSNLADTWQVSFPGLETPLAISLSFCFLHNLCLYLISRL